MRYKKKTSKDRMGTDCIIPFIRSGNNYANEIEKGVTKLIIVSLLFLLTDVLLELALIGLYIIDT